MLRTSTPENSLAQAGDLMRQARVELYCDHPGGALVAIRQAVHQLEQPEQRWDEVELAMLERAAWHVRRHQTHAAVADLNVAIDRLAN